MHTRTIATIIIIGCFCFTAVSTPGMTLDPTWIDDLNRRFPSIGDEFQEAVQQKFAQYEGTLSAEELIAQLLAHPEYLPGKIANAESFGIHSDLMLLYPVIGNYQEALAEARLLRNFILTYPPDNPKVVLTFRGVYAELLILNEQFEQAIQECDETLASYPDEEGIYLNRGVAHVKLQQLDSALNDLKHLLQRPDPNNYAKALFTFLLENRQPFQDSRIQQNTMIDFMIKDLEPQTDTTIRIPASPKLPTQAEPEIQISSPPSESPSSPDATVPSVETPVLPQEISKQETAQPSTSSQNAEHVSLQTILTHDAATIDQVLGTSQFENDREGVIEKDYQYHGNTLTIEFDKHDGHIVSLQMFFMPMVNEAAAFTLMGLDQLDIPPSITTEVLKVWHSYGEYTKVRLSIDGENVMAIIIEP